MQVTRANVPNRVDGAHDCQPTSCACRASTASKFPHRPSLSPGCRSTSASSGTLQADWHPQLPLLTTGAGACTPRPTTSTAHFPRSTPSWTGGSTTHFNPQTTRAFIHGYRISNHNKIDSLPFGLETVCGHTKGSFRYDSKYRTRVSPRTGPTILVSSVEDHEVFTRDKERAQENIPRGNDFRRGNPGLPQNLTTLPCFVPGG